MDLNQRKLIRAEWNSIEIPVSEEEKQVLTLIRDGYRDINIRMNYNPSILSHLKIEFSEKINDYIYIKYCKERCDELKTQIRKTIPDYKIEDIKVKVKLNSADKIRFDKNNHKELINKKDLYENVLIYHIAKFVKYLKKGKTKERIFHYFTLNKLIKNSITHLNSHVLSFCKDIIRCFQDEVSLIDFIRNGDELIEKNKNLIKYDDLSLYDHQKQIFKAVEDREPKLILYMAPTGTGKTLTPIALSEKFKIIFVCAARHVGLAFAKAAISINKKVAFAFGCNSAADIRLHYFAAKEYDRNKRSGGIGKVDNSVGENVEIMICDIKSYLCAMYYMRSFNMDDGGKYLDHNIITYWDEPTITLDYENHEFHEIIKQNWKENVIPNMVLSSATLPKCEELTETISDFRCKFENAQIKSIHSYDCKKSIPILNSEGYVELPHFMSESYDDIIEIVKYCECNLTLLRYFDLKQVCDFIIFINESNFISARYKIDSYFESIDNITMQNIKIYYLLILKNIFKGVWGAVYNHFKAIRIPRLKLNTAVDKNGNKITKSNSIGPGVTPTSININTTGLEGKELTRLRSEQPHTVTVQSSSTVGLLVTTKDSYSLTDGPTIFLTNEIEKISKFCIQQANIPSVVMDDLTARINYNNKLNEQLNTLETEVEYKTEKSESNLKNIISDKKVQGRNKSTKDIRMNNRNFETDGSKSIAALTNEINNLRTMIKPVALNDVFIPNKSCHLKKWASSLETDTSYTSNIDEQTVNEIMLLHGVSDIWKVLLMMGIGVFINHGNTRYLEIIKKMADTQKLYMIIASSDYIYGTNYQFCHGYLSKDLNLSQDKIIQAMGRIGRNNIQQDYTVRFRNNNHINQLFKKDPNKPEVRNMNILFNSNS
jgi:hypothetical protein